MREEIFFEIGNIGKEINTGDVIAVQHKPVRKEDGTDNQTVSCSADEAEGCGVYLVFSKAAINAGQNPTMWIADMPTLEDGKRLAMLIGTVMGVEITS